MSSATSIDNVLPPKSGSQKNRKSGGGPRRQNPGPRHVRVDGDAPADDGFRPWHFFVLASLMAATAAVIMTRQSTPENLVLISLTIGAAGMAAAAFYRMLAPLAIEDLTMFSEPLNERQRAALEREKTLVLRSIKELEFDRAMGKLSPKDFEEMSGRLRTRALSLMKELDEGGTGYREIIERELNARMASVRLRADTAVPGDAGTVRAQPDAVAAADKAPANTCTCGAVADPDAAYCKRCGARLS